MRRALARWKPAPALYNVTAAIEKTSGKPVVERYHYTPYGECTVLHGATDADGAVTEWDEDTGGSDIGNEHLYTGRRTDPGTGLQLNRNRYYHQQLGRWVSRDPIGYDGGSSNLYEYVGGMPVGAVDPSGHNPFGFFWWLFNCGRKTKDGLDCDEYHKIFKKYANECAEEAKKSEFLHRWAAKYSDCGQISPIVNPGSMRGYQLCCVLKKWKANGEDLKLFEDGDGKCLKFILNAPVPPMPKF